VIRKGVGWFKDNDFNPKYIVDISDERNIKTRMFNRKWMFCRAQKDDGRISRNMQRTKNHTEAWII